MSRELHISPFRKPMSPAAGEFLSSKRMTTFAALTSFCRLMSPISVFLCCFLSFITVAGFAQSSTSDAQRQFAEANQLISEARYAEALESYREIESGGDVSGPLYLNMAISATWLDSLGVAKYYFLKARYFAEVRVAAEEGLNFVEDNLARRGARLPELAWTRLSTILMFETNYRFYVILGVIFFNLGGLLFAVHWLRTGNQTVVKISGVVMLIIGFILVIGAISMDNRSARYDLGIQIDRELQVLERPDPNSEIVQTGFEGYQYIIDKKTSAGSPGWSYVRMTNGTSGWVQSSVLLRL
jgi:hypothetical protein